jgi:hypothetical protein
MKFYLIAAVTAMLITGTASAQNVNIGIKGGLNVYNIHNDNNSENDNKIGFHVGLLGHIHMADNFALQPELVFSTQGAKYTSGTSEVSVNLDYINVPLLFQYMFDNGFRLQAGPQVGFLINAKAKSGSAEVDIKDDINGVDFGATFGMSYVNPSSGFGFDARYNLGLSDLNENSSVKSYNRGFQVGVFYLFKHKS